MRVLQPTIISFALLGSLAAGRQAERPRPLPPNVVGTLGLDGTVDTFYRGLHKLLVKAADGSSHEVQMREDTEVHGTRSADPFEDLEEGSHVIVHYVVDGDTKTAVEIDHVGDRGLHVVEGEIVGLDRAAKTLIVELPDHTWMTLRLTDRAAHHAVNEAATRHRVVVYYTEDGGQRAAHYFKKID